VYVGAILVMAASYRDYLVDSVTGKRITYGPNIVKQRGYGKVC
jgi:hypothetical protein